MNRVFRPSICGHICGVAAVWLLGQTVTPLTAAELSGPGSAAPNAAPLGNGPSPSGAIPTPVLQATGPGERNAPPARGPSIAASLELAQRIVAACADAGFHVGVAVIDTAGKTKLAYVADGAGGQHADMAARKAHTALTFKMNSGMVTAARKSDPQLAALWDADPKSYVGNAGGVPLKTGDEIIGAVGVSGGSPSSQDEACALQGLKAVQPMLK